MKKTESEFWSFLSELNRIKWALEFLIPLTENDKANILIIRNKIMVTADLHCSIISTNSEVLLAYYTEHNIK
jgi:hypothetical protein